jgi:hypothetical protein
MNTNIIRRKEVVVLINKIYNYIRIPLCDKTIENIAFAHQIEIKLNNKNLCDNELITMRKELESYLKK